MRERVAPPARAEQPAGMWIGTFHAIGARMLRRDAAQLGLDAELHASTTTATSVGVVKRVDGAAATLTSSSWHAARDPRRDLRAPRTSSSRPRSTQRTATRRVRARRRGASTRATRRALQASRTRSTSTTCWSSRCELLHDPRAVLERYQRALPVSCWSTSTRTPIARSTSFVELLGRRARNICVVGDDDQSIYGWRGADIRNILDFEKDFPDAQHRPAGAELPLDAARSWTRANRVIAQNSGRKGKTLRTESGARRARSRWSRRSTSATRREWIVAEIERAAGGRPRRSRCATSSSSTAPTRSPARWRRRCAAHDMPYRIVGGTRFYERREIKDMLAYLRLIGEPARRRARSRAS